MIEEIEKEIDKKYQEYNKPIISSQRCQFAKTNETIGESKARSKGFLSGLIVAKNIIGEYKEQENKLQSKLDEPNKIKKLKVDGSAYMADIMKIQETINKLIDKVNSLDKEE